MSSFYGGGTAGAPLATTVPVSEATNPAAGTGTAAARSDHVHQRLTSTTVQTTATDGTVTVTFTRTFPAQPGVVIAPYGSGSGALAWEIPTFTQDGGGNYTGCTVRFYRAQTLPALTSIILIGPLITALQNFNVFGGAVGAVTFGLVAIMPSN